MSFGPASWSMLLWLDAGFRRNPEAEVTGIHERIIHTIKGDIEFDATPFSVSSLRRSTYTTQISAFATRRT
jgi:hypothetical protein